MIAIKPFRNLNPMISFDLILWFKRLNFVLRIGFSFIIIVSFSKFDEPSGRQLPTALLLSRIEISYEYIALYSI
jgi:hypothetical protein